MLILVVGCVFAVAAAFPQTQPTAKEWIAFKAQHGKTYASQEEEAQRLKIFNENIQMIESHNKKFERGEVSYKLAVNQFADKLPSEMRLKSNLQGAPPSMNPPLHAKSLKAPPAAVDWRNTAGVVPEVQYMQDCESSWAFSALGSITSQLAIKKNLHFSKLSAQNLIDCTFSLGNNGCHGGWIDNAFKYIQLNGIDSEDDYLYLSYDSTCAFNKTLAVPGFEVTGFMNVSANENDLMDAVATVGPISVTVGAYDLAFMTYAGGIYSPAPASCMTDPQSTNHAVLLVGYGTANNQNFWIIQNFWGGSWGESGYMRLLRNGTNLCGIASQATYPTV